MKVILREEVQLGSGSNVNVYVPKEGAEFATDEAVHQALQRLIREDLKWLGDDVTEMNLKEDEGQLYIHGGDYTFLYNVVEVSSI